MRSKPSVPSQRAGLALALTAVVAATATGSSARSDDAATNQPDRVIIGAVGNSRAEIVERGRELGHPLAGVRVFKRWDDPLLDADERWALRTGHTLFVSVKTRLRDGTLLRWRDIADAAPGSPLHDTMLRHAATLRDLQEPLYLVLNHEPDARLSRPMGTPTDFVAAWRRYVTVLREAGVAGNVRYVWTLTDFAFQQGRAAPYYPGDRYVDAIAADAYNWHTCRGPGGRWASLAELIEPHRQFGLRHPGKALMVLETGSVEDRKQPGRKAQWIRDAAALFTRPGYERYRALLHWDDRHTGPASGTPCEFDYRTSPSAFRAWQAVAARPAYPTG